MSKVTILSKPNRIVIASKGVQGPPGEDGVITPELEGLRDEAQQAAQAAAGSASTASDAAEAAETARQAAVAAQGAAEGSAGQASASAALAEQARLLGATIGFATKADMDASLAHPAGTLALVTNDATPANNGTYRKTGASGSGSWVQSADRVTGLEGRVTSTERVATRAEEMASLAVDGTYTEVASIGQTDPTVSASTQNYSGWAVPIGEVGGFDAVEIGVAAFAPSYPVSQVRVQIRQGAHDGPVIATSGIVDLDGPTTSLEIVQIVLDGYVENTGGHQLWLVIEADGSLSRYFGLPVTIPASTHGPWWYQAFADGPFSGAMTATASNQTRDLYVRFLDTALRFSEELGVFVAAAARGERIDGDVPAGVQDGEARFIEGLGQAVWDASEQAWRLFDDSLVAPDLIHESDFTAPNGTALQSYVPDHGGPWSVTSGAWEIQSGIATATDAGTSRATINAGVSDFVAEWQVTGATSLRRAVFRYVDENNYWTAHYNSNQIGLNLIFDGSTISFGSKAAVGGNPHTLRVSCAGGKIDFTYTSSTGESATISIDDAFEHAQATRVGIQGPQSTAGFDRVRVWRSPERKPVSELADDLSAALDLTASAHGPLRGPGLWNQWVAPLAVYVERRRRRTYWVSVGTQGQEYVSAYDHDTRQTETVVVGKVVGDDHSAGAILPPRPGTSDPLRVVYTGHSDWPYSRLVTFAGPEDLSSWTTEDLPWPGLATYTHLYRYGSRVWLFARAASSGALQARHSDDGGATWSDPVGWFSNQYMLCAQEPDGRALHFATHNHPGQSPTSPTQNIYSFKFDMLTGDVSHPGTGAVLGNVLTGNGLLVAWDSGLLIYASNDGERTRLWDISPWGDVVFQASEDITSGTYWHARVEEGAVTLTDLGPTGTSLDAVPLTNIYMAGICLSRAERDVVWCGREDNGDWWIDRGESIDGGANWTWQQVSERDERKKFRPLPVHGAWPGLGPHPENHVLWCEGRAGAPDGGYTYYRGQYVADVVGR